MCNTASVKLFSSNVMNAVDALIVVLDLQGNIVFVNTACEKLSGFKLQEVKDKTVWDVYVAEEDIADTKAVFSALVTFQEDNRHINYWKTNTGDKRLVSFSNTCLKDDGGNMVYIVATGIDITDQRADQVELEAREAKFQSIIRTAPDSIIIIDEKGIIIEVNPAVEDVFGYESEELIGQNISILMPEPFRREHDSYLHNYAKTGEKKIIGIGRELMAMHKDGNIFPIYLSVSEIWLGGKNLFTGIIRDLTKMKEQEEKLRRAHKIEALGQLTGGIAHDFNNLLTIILGNLEIIEAKNLNPDAVEILNEVYEVIGQGTQLVSQLLAFGKRQSLDPEIIDVNATLRQLIKLLKRTFRENIEFEKKLLPDVWKTYADVTQIENALLNIMINARDAMLDGGTIIVKTANVNITAKNVLNSLSIPAGEYVELSVSDTGVGMADDVLAKAFDPFFTTKRVGLGTGLGLSMVHGFVQQSSGGINIESENGKGTTVSIYLPQAKDTVGNTRLQKKDVAHSLDGHRKKILHVEDDARVRQINTRRLIGMGYEVLTAKDAPTALNILSEHDDVDIVFSDIVMPGSMSGVELAAEIRTHYPKIQILLTTGYSREIVAGKGGENSILRKPFTREELAHKLWEISHDL